MQGRGGGGTIRALIHGITYVRDKISMNYRVSQKKRSLRIFTPLGATDASGDNSVGQGCWGDVG